MKFINTTTEDRVSIFFIEAPLTIKFKSQAACTETRDCYYYCYNHFMVLWTVSGTTLVSWYQKGKTK